MRDNIDILKVGHNRTHQEMCTFVLHTDFMYLRFLLMVRNNKLVYVQICCTSLGIFDQEKGVQVCFSLSFLIE